MFRKISLFVMLLMVLGGYSASTAQVSFPQFTYRGVALHPSDLSYNPTDEIIFPSVIRAADYFSNPLATYYMYYAPHDPPGGISLAYSNSLNGPWTEYPNNPLISNTWSPYYSTVSHISSPDVIWNSDENKLFLYFHGENYVTRLASSTNGINFTYEKAVLQCSDVGWANGSCEASYARVSKHTIPGLNNKYIMLFMGKQVSGGCCDRRIHLGWSNDGRNWTYRANPVLQARGTQELSTQGYANASGAWFFPWNGGYYVVYHTSAGKIFVAEVGAAFDREIHLGVFHEEPGERTTGPAFFQEGNTLYMFYEKGARLEQYITWATADLSAPSLETVIVDNPQASVSGQWVSSTGTSDPFYGSDYFHDDNSGKGSKQVTFTPTLQGGTYEVYARWTSNLNRATNVPVVINHSGGSTTQIVNQQQNGGQWRLLGTYTFATGSGGSIIIRNAGTNGYVVADAVRLVQTALQPSEVVLDNSSGSGVTIQGTWITSTGSAGYYGSNYLHDDNSGKGTKSVTYTPNIPASGSYQVFVRWTSHPNRSPQVPIDIQHANGTNRQVVDQRSSGGLWVSVGTYSFNSGTSHRVIISTLATAEANGYVVADAVRFVPAQMMNGAVESNRNSELLPLPQSETIPLPIAPGN